MRIDPCQNKCNVISIWQVTIKFQIYDLVSRIFICYLSKLWGKLIAFLLEVKNENDLSWYWFQNEYANIKRIWKNKYTKNLYFLSNIPKKFIKYWPLILHSILLNSSMMNTNWFIRREEWKKRKKEYIIVSWSIIAAFWGYGTRSAFIFSFCVFIYCYDECEKLDVSLCIHSAGLTHINMTTCT